MHQTATAAAAGEAATTATATAAAGGEVAATTATAAAAGEAAADSAAFGALVGHADALADRLVVTARHCGTAGLRSLTQLLGAVDRMTAAVVSVLGSADHADVIAAEGLTAAAWVRAVAGRTGGDAGMLLAAADRLGDMPAVAAWFADGTLSWGAVRGIVAAARNLTGEQRRWVDTTLAEERERVARLDGDEVIAAVDRLVNRARPDLEKDRADRAFDRRYLALQPGLDGTGRIYGELDAETTAAALQAFDTTPAPDHDHDHDRDDGEGDDGGGSDDGWGRRQSNHDTFRALCQQRLTRHHHTINADPAVGDHDLAGDNDPDVADPALGDNRDAAGRREPAADLYARHGGAPSTARPSMLIVADITTLTGDDPLASATAQLLWRTTRSPLELTAQATQRLACDATFRVVLVDGAVPLGVGAAHPKVSASLRATLTVRDGGCRFTGCRQPAERCDAHHVVPREADGPTVLDNLALLCLAHHHAVHEGGWHATLHDDATMTFTRRGSTLTSLPRAHQHITPATPPPPGRPGRPGRVRTNRTAAEPPQHTPADGTDPDARASPPRPSGPPPLPF